MKDRLLHLLRRPLTWVYVFFGCYLLLGIGIHRDFGISWDEKVQRGTGGVNVKYVLTRLMPGYVAAHPEIQSIPDLMTYQDRDYGATFEMILVAGEKALGYQENTAGLFYYRHLMNFLFFWLASIFFCLLVQQRFQSWYWALAGTLLFVLAPRIFADSFYNSKDLVFLSALVIGVYAMLQFLQKRSWRHAVLFGFAAAFATDIRILGIMLPMTGVFFWGWDWALGGEKRQARTELLALGAFALSFGFFLVLLWPFLWPNPVGNFLYAFQSMSKFRWDGRVFFLGEYYNGNALPAWYVPVWAAVSSPLLVVLALIPGAVRILLGVVRARLRLYADDAGRRDLIALCMMGAPVLATIVLGSTLYSGWRQLYFIWPLMVLVALSALHALSRWEPLRGRGNWVVGGLISAQVLLLCVQLVRMHPYGNVYFNVLAGSDPARHFEMDYWGLAYRQGLEYVAQQDNRDTLYLKVGSYPGKVNHSMLSAADQARIQYVASPDSAHYVIAPPLREGQEIGDRVYTVSPAGMNILTVWKLR